MNGQGDYFTQPDGQGIVFSGDVGVPNPGEGPAARPITRSPVTSRFRKIGNPSPGFLGDIKTWWTGLKPEYRWGAFGAAALVGVIIAATQKGGGKSSSVKRI